MGGRQGWSKFVGLVTCALLAGPVLVDLALSPKLRPFGYAAGDTFYYLDVARVAVERGSISSDGLHATNGFHPLWQLCTIVVYAVCHATGQQHAALGSLILLSLCCATAALWQLSRAFAKTCGRVPTALALVPIGPYALMASYHWHMGPKDAGGGVEGPLPVYGTLYSYVNGMESGLTLLAFAILVKTFVSHEGRSAARSGLRCGLSCALLALARLDHAAFAVAPLLMWTLELLQPLPRWRFLVAALTAAILPVAAYCIINLLYVGVALPVSGAEKSHFPLPYPDQLAIALKTLKAPFRPLEPAVAFRVLPIVVSALAALAYAATMIYARLRERSLVFGLRTYASRLDLVLVKMVPGVLLLAGYDLMFVDGIGHWYFPVSTLFVSLCCVSLWHAATRRSRLGPTWSASALAGASALVIALFFRFQYKPSYHASYAKFYWETAPRVALSLQGKVPPFIEQDDGIISYSLGVPSMSGSGYLLDPEAAYALTNHRLVDVAYHRGFRSVASFYYSLHGTLKSPSDARNWAQHLLGQDLSNYDATVLYDDATFSLVQLDARQDSS